MVQIVGYRQVSEEHLRSAPRRPESREGRVGPNIILATPKMSEHGVAWGNWALSLVTPAPLAPLHPSMLSQQVARNRAECTQPCWAGDEPLLHGVNLMACEPLGCGRSGARVCCSPGFGILAWRLATARAWTNDLLFALRTETCIV
jgi:hypothetical protein